MSNNVGFARARSRVGLSLVWCATWVALSGATLAQPRVAFVTSATGNGDLASWADAEGRFGLQAADHVCQVLAARAGLASSEDFVAWMSDSADDAYCRVQGLQGKRANLCGQATLPAAAGPWVRTDGLPFAASLPALLNEGHVFYPLVLDETGQPRVSSVVLTATSGLGELEGSACSDWTAADDQFVSSGNSGAGTRHWQTGASGPCSSSVSRRLACLQSGTGGPLPSFAPLSERVAFVTTSRGTGDLGSWPAAGGAQGVPAGDAVCVSRASAAGLASPGSFKAWLSTASPARDRFVHDGPWQRLDRVRIADSLDDLTDGVLTAALNVDDAGNYRANPIMWTGTDNLGGATGDHCASWTSAAGAVQGTAGWPNYSQFWSRVSERNCDNNAGHLYCFADVAPAAHSCTPGPGVLCLGAGGRFRVTIRFETPAGEQGEGRTVDIGRRDSGLFYFFDPDNMEMLVKLLDGCAINGHFWVFFAATTDVGFELTVDDVVAGTSRVYDNPVGLAAPPVLDTVAFATCNAPQG
ncbi:MAG TPA: hypothetical protein VNB06_16160 [Thermoanaerobaculia bacterium]|nr:hypothetical protein [Thermoanaerobaculia bacterium]